MPVPLSHLCALLSELEALATQLPPLPTAALHRASAGTVQAWFTRQRDVVDSAATDRAALLSALFPERRPDRVFSIQSCRLSQMLGRCLCFGKSKMHALGRWRSAGHGDLGACLERILRPYDVEPRSTSAVTVEEVDAMLHALASRVPFSAPAVRSTGCRRSPEQLLGHILIRLKSAEAKWLVRIILKDLSPALVGEHEVFSNIHFLLPDLLRVQDDFQTAVAWLHHSMSDCPSTTDPKSQKMWRTVAARLLVPRVGVTVGKAVFYKARSLANLLSLLGQERWLVEQKYDGEHCEIHVDLSKRSNCIQIFSKSGKDSTDDRVAVHDAVKQFLRVSQPACRLKQKCILLGELVVVNRNRADEILPFHKIRKHVSRSGRFIGTWHDSPTAGDEALMVMLYDILLLDDEITMARPVTERKRALRQLGVDLPGQCTIAPHDILDFGLFPAEAAGQLRDRIKRCIADRHEGLVLKPCTGGYVSFELDQPGKIRGKFIKLKRHAIPGLGDTVDFAIVGASYETIQARKRPDPSIRWTTFFIACLENKEAVDRFDARPSYRVVDTIRQHKCISKANLESLNTLGQFRALEYAKGDNPAALKYDLTFPPRQTVTPSVVFTEPFLCEVLGDGFDKGPNAGIYTLRFPRIVKLHSDRGWRDLISVGELQDLARQATTALDGAETGQAASAMDLYLGPLISATDASCDAFQSTTQSTQASTAVSVTLTNTPRKGDPLVNYQGQSHDLSTTNPSVAMDKDSHPTSSMADLHPAEPSVVVGAGAQSPSKRRLHRSTDRPLRPSKRQCAPLELPSLDDEDAAAPTTAIVAPENGRVAIHVDRLDLSDRKCARALADVTTSPPQSFYTPPSCLKSLGSLVQSSTTSHDSGTSQPGRRRKQHGLCTPVRRSLVHVEVSVSSKRSIFSTLTVTPSMATPSTATPSTATPSIAPPSSLRAADLTITATSPCEGRSPCVWTLAAQQSRPACAPALESSSSFSPSLSASHSSTTSTASTTITTFATFSPTPPQPRPGRPVLDLANSAVVLAASIPRRDRADCVDELVARGALPTASLSHWVRDLTGGQEAVVGESQAYPDLVKVVLFHCPAWNLRDRCRTGGKGAGAGEDENKDENKDGNKDENKDEDENNERKKGTDNGKAIDTAELVAAAGRAARPVIKAGVMDAVEYWAWQQDTARLAGSDRTGTQRQDRAIACYGGLTRWDKRRRKVVFIPTPDR